jgi:hypothetical protein
MASTTYSSNSTHKDIPLERRRSVSSVDSDPVGVYFVSCKQPLRIELDTDSKQHGPHDTTRHSRWPVFLRMRGSVVPAMILPLTFITLWATCITCISKFVYEGSKYSISAVPISYTSSRLKVLPAALRCFAARCAHENMPTLPCLAFDTAYYRAPP